MNSTSFAASIRAVASLSPRSQKRDLGHSTMAQNRAVRDLALSDEKCRGGQPVTDPARCPQRFQHYSAFLSRTHLSPPGFFPMTLTVSSIVFLALYRALLRRSSPGRVILKTVVVSLPYMACNQYKCNALSRLAADRR